jgi:hypothetical protein
MNNHHDLNREAIPSLSGTVAPSLSPRPTKGRLLSIHAPRTLVAARRRAVQIERMIAEFDCMVNALDAEILVEQSRARINDPTHFAYPTYAKAAILRRDNLKRSVERLKDLLCGHDLGGRS